uniref:Reverse transcriptase zinc-binding domain-containing protein n=1 Tax=Medicago truncatula TaxID=3880 RepID=A2Q533_MEDTR|nr:hypothetical protein MtrDRAFT_AC158497g41v2 [Medicago truncatula]
MLRLLGVMCVAEREERERQNKLQEQKTVVVKSDDTLVVTKKKDDTLVLFQNLNIRRVLGDGHGTLFWYDHWVGESPLRFKYLRLFDLVVHKDWTVAVMEQEGWEEGGGGGCGVDVDVTAKWSWTLDTVHGYSVREAYRFVASHCDHSDRNIVHNVWHRHIPTKVSLFVWRLLCNRLPTRGNLLRRNIVQPNNSLCVIGCEVVETAGHLFLSCENYCIVWSLISAWLGLSLVHQNDLQQHYHQFCYMAGFPRSTHAYFTGIWYASVWVIWKDRNKRIFQNEASHSLVLMEKIKCNSFFWMKARNTSFNYCFYDW